MNIETLKDLKVFLGTLNETQLNQKAVLQIVDSGVEHIRFGSVNTEVEVLTDEGFIPKSCIDEPDEIISDETRPVGHVYLLNEI